MGKHAKYPGLTEVEYIPLEEEIQEESEVLRTVCFLFAIVAITLFFCALSLAYA